MIIVKDSDGSLVIEGTTQPVSLTVYEYIKCRVKDRALVTINVQELIPWPKEYEWVTKVRVSSLDNHGRLVAVLVDGDWWITLNHCPKDLFGTWSSNEEKVFINKDGYVYSEAGKGPQGTGI